MPLIAHWFRAFAWTLLFEQLAAGFLLREALPARARRVSVITVANIASHPAVWLIFPELCSGLGLTARHGLILSEIWALSLEAWIYWLFLGSGRLTIALKTSAAANALSLGAGLVLRYLGWV